MKSMFVMKSWNSHLLYRLPPQSQVGGAGQLEGFLAPSGKSGINTISLCTKLILWSFSYIVVYRKLKICGLNIRRCFYDHNSKWGAQNYGAPGLQYEATPPSKGISLFLSNVLNCSSQCSQYICNITAFLPLRRSLWALHPIVKAFEAEDSNKQDYLNPWTIITPAINKIIQFINKIKCLWVQFELKLDQMFNLWGQNLARDELNGQHCQTSERSISKTSTLNSIKLSAGMMMFRQLSSRNGHWARNEVSSHVLWEAPSVDLWLIVW